MTAALEMLVARLLWATPRVRWESARQLSALIKEGDSKAAAAFLEWVGGRDLESEVVIGASMVDAFGLAEFIDIKALYASIKAPSLLSDALLRRNSLELGLQRTSRYAFGPENVDVPERLRQYFDYNLGAVVPLIFRSSLRRLQEQSAYPFVERWLKEWVWLQESRNEVLSQTPRFFFSGDRDATGSFDVRQREMYVSAYLRTFAFAMANWRLPLRHAEHYSFLGLPMNRGLASHLPSDRPTWTFGLMEQSSRCRPRDLALAVWTEAMRSVSPNEVPISLSVVDRSRKGFCHIEIDRVAMPEGIDDRGPPPRPHDRLWVGMDNTFGDLVGALKVDPEWATKLGTETVPMAVAVQPSDYGRFHYELFPTGIRLAGPFLFEKRVAVGVEQGDIVLRQADSVVSRAKIWNSSWAPTHPKGVLRLGGTLVSAESSAVTDFLARDNLAQAVSARICIGERQQVYEECTEKEEVCWLDSSV